MNLYRPLARCAALALVFALSACGAKAPSEQESGPAVEYVVGTDASYAPFESTDAHQAIQGFDIDVLSAIARREGFRVRFVNTPWEGIFATLDKGSRDILASAITINPERKKLVDFSDPYFNARQLIAVQKGENEIGSFRDLRGETVAVQVGTTADEDLQRLMGHDNPDIRRYQTMSEALAALQSGQVRAVVGDNGVVSGFVRSHPESGLFTVEDTASFTPERYGFAVRKGRKDLLAKINAGLAAVRADGTYDALYKKYFGDSK